MYRNRGELRYRRRRALAAKRSIVKSRKGSEKNNNGSCRKDQRQIDRFKDMMKEDAA